MEAAWHQPEHRASDPRHRQDALHRPDGPGRLLTLRSSKTDQEDAGSCLYLGRAASRALRSIRPEDADLGGKVFGVTGRTLSNRLRAMAAAGRLSPQSVLAILKRRVSGYSRRRGSATSLAPVRTRTRW